MIDQNKLIELYLSANIDNLKLAKQLSICLKDDITDEKLLKLVEFFKDDIGDVINTNKSLCLILDKFLIRKKIGNWTISHVKYKIGEQYLHSYIFCDNYSEYLDNIFKEVK